MLDINDFSKKQIIVYCPAKGDKISYKNDNLIIKNSDGKIKYQHTCYRIFMVLVIGDTSITTGLIRRAKKFNFSILFMSYGFKLYAAFNAGLQGNTMLHDKQYHYSGNEIAQHIIANKIYNQRYTLTKIRKKTEYIKEGIVILDEYYNKLRNEEVSRESLLGYEGNASRVYFPRIFFNTEWKNRKPRIKFDYLNSLLDIGYTILFNFIDCILNVFGFDVYKGVLHTDFYMRKSLVCDIVEPFRPLIDWKVRTGINLGQFKKEDFVFINNSWQLQYKKSALYGSVFMEELLENKEMIFLYIRSYYRAFMKGTPIGKYPVFDIDSDEVICDVDNCDIETEMFVERKDNLPIDIPFRPGIEKDVSIKSDVELDGREV